MTLTDDQLWREIGDAERENRPANFDPLDLEQYLLNVHERCVCPLCDYELGDDE